MDDRFGEIQQDSSRNNFDQLDRYSLIVPFC